MEPHATGEKRLGNTMRHHVMFERGRAVYCNCFRGMRIGDGVKWPGGRVKKKDARFAERWLWRSARRTTE